MVRHWFGVSFDSGIRSMYKRRPREFRGYRRWSSPTPLKSPSRQQQKNRVNMKATTAPLAALLLVSSLPSPGLLAWAKHIMIPSTSFDSQADFDTDWNYNYPWGTDHNGAARMAKGQV